MPQRPRQLRDPINKKCKLKTESTSAVTFKTCKPNLLMMKADLPTVKDMKIT